MIKARLKNKIKKRNTNRVARKASRRGSHPKVTERSWRGETQRKSLFPEKIDLKCEVWIRLTEYVSGTSVNLCRSRFDTWFVIFPYTQKMPSKNLPTLSMMFCQRNNKS